jgi:uncharacterized membrane protein
MPVTFGVTTEAIRRGPLGAVSPITALSPTLTAVLAISVLHERVGIPVYVGVAVAPTGIVLLSLGRPKEKVSLLLMSAAVQVVVGLFLAPPGSWRRHDLLRRAAGITVFAYVLAGTATVGYLAALASGPASVVVPLVATSPALAGLAGILFLNERTSKQQLVGITLALMGAVLLAAQA